MKNLKNRSSGIVHYLSGRNWAVALPLCSSPVQFIPKTALIVDEPVTCKKCLKRRARIEGEGLSSGR